MAAREHIGRIAGTGGAFWFLTTVIVLLAGIFSGAAFRFRHPALDGDLFVRFANGDGAWYQSIAEHGYQHGVGEFSDTAFFPAFPCCARWVAWATSLRTEAALFVVANLCFVATFVAAAAYMSCRYPESPADVTEYALLSLGLIPTTFFFRMAYAESMFVSLTILFLYGLARGWPLLVLAFIVGLATGTRPVGVALVPVFALHAWRTFAPPRDG